MADGTLKQKLEEYGWALIPEAEADEGGQYFGPPDESVQSDLGAILRDDAVYFVSSGYPAGTAHSTMELGGMLSRMGYHGGLPTPPGKANKGHSFGPVDHPRENVKPSELSTPAGPARVSRPPSIHGQPYDRKGSSLEKVLDLRTAASATDLFAVVPELTHGRKVDSWQTAPSSNFARLLPEGQQLLQSLPVVRVNLLPKNCLTDFENYAPDAVHLSRSPFILAGPNRQIFLIDPQGYDYARYVVRLQGFKPAASKITPAVGDDAAGQKVVRDTSIGEEPESPVSEEDDKLLRKFESDDESPEELEAAWEKEAVNPKRDPNDPDKPARRPHPVDPENPQQGIDALDTPVKWVVHVAGQALEGLTKAKHDYVNTKKAEGVLKKLVAKSGVKAIQFFSIGYDDVSFEVASEKDATKAVDFLNKTLPKSTESGGYGYGTAWPAQASSYDQETDQHEGDEFSSPGDWHYPEGEL